MIPQWLVDSRYWGKMSLKAKAAYMVIARHANYETSNALVSNNIIALETGLGLQSVIRAKKELKDSGLIKVWQTKFNGSCVCHIIRDLNKVVQKAPPYIGVVDKEVSKAPSYQNQETVPQVLKAPTPGVKSTLVGCKKHYLNRDSNRDIVRKGEIMQSQKPEDQNQPKKESFAFSILGPKPKRSVDEISDEKIMDFLKRMTVQELCAYLVRLGYEQEEIEKKLKVK